MDRPQRRDFLIAAGAFLAAPLAAEAQQTGKIARIGFLAVNIGPLTPTCGRPFSKGCGTSAT